uniref:ORF3 n=1 Tax=Dezidougou virus TaxID=1170421 RepID=A0AAU8JN62_9VIRU
MVMRRTGTAVRPKTTVTKTVSVPATKTPRPKTTPNGVGKLDFSRFFNYATGVLTDTTFVMFFILSAYLCYDYNTGGDKSHIVKFVTNFVTQFSSFKASKCTILNLILVAVPFIPAIFTVTPKNRFGAIACTFLYYVFVPERTVYEYLIHGAIIYLILRTNVRQYRMIGVVLLFLSYVMQFTLPLPTGAAYKCNSTASG